MKEGTDRAPATKQRKIRFTTLEAASSPPLKHSLTMLENRRLSLCDLSPSKKETKERINVCKRFAFLALIVAAPFALSGEAALGQIAKPELKWSACGDVPE